VSINLTNNNNVILFSIVYLAKFQQNGHDNGQK